MSQLTLKAAERYLWIPIHPSAPKVWLSIQCEGRPAVHLEAAVSSQPLWHAFIDLNECFDRTVWISSSEPLDADFSFHAQMPPALGAGQRPLMRFTAPSGWINDPNGLFFLHGEYHLFFQHNPYGTDWGNMHWGHVVSRDLIHWQQLGEALAPDETGSMFSGCAVVDTRNVSGLGNGRIPPVLLFYTADTASWPYAEKTVNGVYIACSTDGGRTFCKTGGRSVLDDMGGGDRDPKVVWVPELDSWLLLLYKDDERKHAYAQYLSRDLLHWRRGRDLFLAGDSECPDLFALWVDGNPQRKRWVFWGASGYWRTGHFEKDGLVLDGEAHRSQVFSDEPSYYAAQTFHRHGLPEDGTALQIHWLRCAFEHASYNHQMSFPVALTLRETNGEERLCMQPAPEAVSCLRETLALAGADAARINEEMGGRLASGSYLRLERSDAPFELVLAGQPLRYANGRLTTTRGDVPIPQTDGRIVLEAIADGNVLELFWQEGRQNVLLRRMNDRFALSFGPDEKADVRMCAYE